VTAKPLNKAAHHAQLGIRIGTHRAADDTEKPTSHCIQVWQAAARCVADVASSLGKSLRSSASGGVGNGSGSIVTALCA
jgi:hypothetical protein